MQLAAWTICSSCCEAHLSKVACPRCTGSRPAAGHKRIDVPAAMKVAPRLEPARPDRKQAGRVPVGMILSVLVFFAGLALVGLGVLPALGIVLCAVPVIVQATLRSRERRAERHLVANLGLRLE